MAAVTQRVGNYLGGVSKQSDDKKLPNQVRECLNGYPDPTFGLTKRPGFKWIANLGTGTTLDNARWFYIHRDSNEKYIGCIKPTTIAVTNNGTSGATDKTGVTVNATSGSGDKNNTTVNLTASGGVVTGITFKDAGSGFATNDTITITASAAGTGANVVGTVTLGDIDIWNATTGAVCTVTYASGAQSYLTGYRNNYDVVTVQDTSIITNNLVTAKKLDDATANVTAKATIVLDQAVAGEYDITINGNAISTYDAPATDTYNALLQVLKTRIEGLSVSGLTVAKYDASLELTCTSTFTISGAGGASNNKLAVFQDKVDNVAQLPFQSTHNRVVKIINTSSDKDTYYAKFVADNGTSGRGYWEETLDPNTSPGLNQSTMPHELVNTDLNEFQLKKINWTARTVGDDVTNSHPSFVDQKIQQAFFHNNRLGFLSRDNVSMSQSQAFYNFYHTSAQAVTDADPVDLSCSTIRPAALHGVLPTTQGLVLFSKNQQFLMSAADGILTPTTTSISTISNYEMDVEVDPVDMGTNINFISKTPSYTRIFGMVTRGQDENPQVLDVGRVVNEWVPATIDTFIASPQNQFLAMSSQTDEKVYLYRTYSDGEKNLVEAWFNWQLPGKVQNIAVDQDDMFAVTKQGNQITLSVASMSQSPSDAIIVNNDGSRINPCMDLYASASNVAGNKKVDYDATNEFSKCYIPWNNVTGLTPVIVIKGTTATGQFTESGFTTTPTVVTDDGDPYFKVEGKNLKQEPDGTSIEDDVIVGWKYDLDVILPKTYFRPDDARKQTDYTANLTIARMKFAVGLSGVMGFKLKPTGIRQGEKRHTGWDLNPLSPLQVGDLNWNKDELSYIDREQVKVRINNVVTTDFTFVNDTTIRMGSVPQQVFNNTGSGGAHTFTWTFDRTVKDKIVVQKETSAGSGVYTTQSLNVDYTVPGIVGSDKTIVFIDTNGVPTAVPQNVKVRIYSADDIVIYLDEWYNLNPTQMADTYLANDIALKDQSVFAIPIHQKTDNFQLRVFNDSPFPVSLNSMMWEGNYSPRFYRRI